LYYPSYYPQQHANQLPAFPATPAPYRGAPTSLEPVREPPTAAPPPPDIKKENFTQFSSALIISVPVQCSFATLHSRFSTSIQQNWPEHTAESELGHICVQKVLSMNRFKRRNEEHSVQLLCCNGPSPGQKSPPEQMRWL
jgi:hypothetical protein